MIMDITITNTISPEEYLGLRQAVGWSVFPREQAKSGLQNSHVICFRDKEKAIALGRVIWDHGYSILISDVIVAPEYQGKGLGRRKQTGLLQKVWIYRKTKRFVRPWYASVDRILNVENGLINKNLQIITFYFVKLKV